MEKYPILELVVKIASRCNLNCTYCYEYNTGDDTWKKASKFMLPETAEKLSERVQEHIDEFGLKEFTFGLHGGEPLLMNPDDMDKLIASLKSRIRQDVPLHFGVQTNALLMSEPHIAVFKKHGVHVSISLDGLEKTHDKNRLDFRGQPSWQRVLDGISLLKTHAPELFIGILSVIDIDSDPLETFDFLSSFNVDIDFLLPLKNHDTPPYYPAQDRLAYGKWYFAIYREWVRGRNSHIDVRFIKNIIGQLMGGTAIYEVMTSNPIGLLTVSTDGGIEGLDCLKSTGAGVQFTGLSIQNSSFSQALEHEVVRLRQTGVSGLNKKCQECRYLYGCAGGYFPNRYSKGRGFDNPSVYCEDLYWLLANMEEDIKNHIPRELAFV